ncbi:hypothetical protein B0H14DRAFT_3025004, partial [Mycena olivaceomarginata]
MNLHDICPFDGKFRLFIFPGDVREQCSKDELAEFRHACASTRYCAGSLMEMVETHIILDNDSSVVVESMPEAMLALHGYQGYQGLYFGGGDSGCLGLYERFQVSSRHIAFLVRPDNHIAAITRMDEVGASTLDSYFASWINI